MNGKQLYDPTLPSFFLAWARRNEIEVAPELVKAVEARGVVIDYKARGTAQRLKGMTDKIGARVDDGTIAKALAEIPDALETRVK